MAITRVFDLIQHYRDKFGDKPVAFSGKESGKWRDWSFSEFERLAYALASGLIRLGLRRGDRVAIVSNNRPEWNIVDFGVQLAGGILVPIYPTISENDLRFILADSETRFIFLSSQVLYDKTTTVTKETLTKPLVYTFDKTTALSWREVIAEGEANPDNAEIEKIKRETKPDEICTILYTSGTTGTPKGVMLTHGNLVSNFSGLCDLPPVDETSKVLSFLPLNHIYERIIVYVYLFRGPSVYYAESLETIGDNIREVKPHMFTCVPHLIQKVYNRITSKGAELTGVKHKLFFWAVRLGEQFEVTGNSWWYNLKLKIASKLIFSKWREALGGNVRAMVSGGAALEPRLARIFWAAGMPILEGYGLTETSPVIAVNTFEPGGMRFGTVGKVVKDVQVKFAEDGEILVKGPNVMQGYYKRPDLTAEVIDKDGWFHTGDIGTMVDGSYLKITDRKKEIFKTSGGKYIAPQLLENLLKTSRFVEQSMIIGENQKYAAALIVPSFAFLKEWAKRKGVNVGETNEQIITNPEVLKRIFEAVEKINAQLAQYERIKRIILLPKEWTTAGGELTPKLSIKRKIILEQNKGAIEKLYGEG
ncbi:MAG TPA: long-chain fatty acid--CoA ligase [Bacteroidia bacterium]|nr:long-chain fatty acid--CoA ligase [Bacteroidia bacterium]